MTEAATTLDDITALCRAYADAREALEEITDSIAQDRRQAVRRRLRALKARVVEASAAKEALKAALAGAPELFEKPRTRAIEGIKVGFRKQPGRIEVADEARSIGRVRVKLPEKAEALIVTRETLDRNALKQLSVKELASIGAVLADDEDEVVIKAAKTDLDKLVDALLDDGEEAGE
ncbi:MAG: hypothetical protein OXK73_12950 [Rhodospirillaceae bacterium]|nr:hypothetical protein [Rhodospirillaceae bacterium]